MNKNFQLEACDIKHFYGQRLVIDIDHLTIEKGQIYALVGPNGSGKTTLLHILSFILKPRQGQLFFNGQLVKSDEPSRKYIRQHMTVVTQNPFMFRGSVKANVEYGLRARGLEKKEREKLVDEILMRNGLTEFKNRNARQLSGGEMQLVALVRGLVLKPAILFLDEITANLDLKHVRALEQLIRDINKESDMTIIMTTHRLSQAHRLADRVLSLFAGRLVASGMDNLFKGKIINVNTTYFFVTGSIRIRLGVNLFDNKKQYLTINPEEIRISQDLPQDKIENVFSGEVIMIRTVNTSVHIEVKAQEVFRIHMKKSFFDEMGFSLGTKVYIFFTTNSLQLL